MFLLLSLELCLAFSSEESHSISEGLYCHFTSVFFYYYYYCNVQQYRIQVFIHLTWIQTSGLKFRSQLSLQWDVEMVKSVCNTDSAIRQKVTQQICYHCLYFFCETLNRFCILCPTPWSSITNCFKKASAWLYIWVMVLLSNCFLSTINNFSMMAQELEERTAFAQRPCVYSRLR